MKIVIALVIASIFIAQCFGNRQCDFKQCSDNCLTQFQNDVKDEQNAEEQMKILGDIYNQKACLATNQQCINYLKSAEHTDCNTNAKEELTALTISCHKECYPDFEYYTSIFQNYASCIDDCLFSFKTLGFGILSFILIFAILF